MNRCALCEQDKDEAMLLMPGSGNKRQVCATPSTCRALAGPTRGRTVRGAGCAAGSRRRSTGAQRWPARLIVYGKRNGEGTLAPKRKDRTCAAETLVTDAADTDGSYLVAVPQDLFLRLAAIATCSCVPTEDFVVAILERTVLPHDLNTAAHATELTIYDD